MVEIFFEVHGTTTDNEQKIGTGHSPGELSEKGIKESQELGSRYKDRPVSAVFCSDLKRASDTAEIAFRGTKIPIFKDGRLRECDYGAFTRHPSEEVKAVKINHIKEPFPGGQSYEETTDLVRSFLRDLQRDYDGQKVLIIGHAATQYALEQLLNHKSLREAISEPWQWQPGWTYYLKGL